MAQSPPTIKDVAARVGVSRQTVSRVINNKPEVSPETRSRVQAAIDELGYRPNAAARSMVSGRSCMLGCVAPNLIDYTFAAIIETAQAQARRMGYFILTGSAPTLADVEPLLEEMLLRQVDGLLVLNPCMDDRSRFFLQLPEKGTPVVYVASSPEGARVPVVHCDDFQGGLQATQYLIELGHRSIATVVGDSDQRFASDRLEGYYHALQEAGLEGSPGLVMSGDWSATSGYRAVQRLLKSRQRFTAIFAQNDRMAVGVIKALRAAGLRVPEDVSVLGFDDIPLASYFDPPLTTLRQPMESFGRQAAQLLIKTIENPATGPQQITLPARLIVRASCAHQ